MPGRSWSGPLPALTPAQLALSDQLRADVQWIAGDIGERNVFTPDALRAAEEGLGERLARSGLGRVERQSYFVHDVQCANLWLDVRGVGPLADQVLLYGAHYDSIRRCRAANDNGSGVAAVLALMRDLAERPLPPDRPRRTVRLALFVNEEPPWFWSDDMGSLRLARLFKSRGDRITGMITPETIGYYSDAPGSQHYPLPLRGLGPYSSRGDFIAFIGLGRSAPWVRRVVGAFRHHAQFPSLGAALPGFVPGIGSSDHWSFWRCGYPALMVTDTAPFRYPHYHRSTDTPDQLAYERMARVVEGLNHAVRDLTARP